MILGNSAAVDEDLRRRGMKRYVPTGAMAENCDSENHRSKIRIVVPDDKTTEDEESDEEKRKGERTRKPEDKKAAGRVKGHRTDESRSKEQDGDKKTKDVLP